MTVEVQWDNPEQTVIRFDFAERWTLDEFEAVRKIAYQMYDKSPHQGMFGVLLIFPPRAFLPENILSIVRRQISVKHIRTGMIVVVSNNSYVKILCNMLVTVYRPARAVFTQTDNIEEGRALLLARLQAAETPNK